MTPQAQFNHDVAAFCTRTEQTQPRSLLPPLSDSFIPGRCFLLPSPPRVSFATKCVALELCSWSPPCELRIPPQGLRWKARGSPGCWGWDVPPRPPLFHGTRSTPGFDECPESLQASTTLIAGITVIFQQSHSRSGFPPTQHCWCGFSDVLWHWGCW